MANVKASDNREKQTPPRSYFRRATDIYSVWCWLTVRGCTVSVKDFLKQRAVNISVGGHYTLANWFDSQGKPRTFACRTSRVSPFRMLVAVPVVGKVGDRVTSYFGDFGKLDGLISDTVAGGFLLELAITKGKREQLANKLTWLEKKQKDPTVRDVRAQSR